MPSDGKEKRTGIRTMAKIAKLRLFFLQLLLDIDEAMLAPVLAKRALGANIS